MDREGGGGEPSEGRMRAALESGLRSRLGELVVQSGSKLRDIAKLLDAEDFVVHEGRGIRGFDTFDFKGFTEREWKMGRRAFALPEKIDHVSHVILPPGDGEITRGDGSGVESKENIPRTKYLIDVLTDLKIPYEIVSGEITPNMVRQQTYNVFVLDAQKKLVFVNNEEGNATFIVYNVHAPKEEWEIYASFTKDELGVSQDVARVIYSGEADWKEKLRTLLLYGSPVVAVVAGRPAKTAIATEARKDRPPDGWLSVRGLSAELERDWGLINKLSKDTLAKGVGTIQKFRNPVNGQEREYLSPEAVSAIRSIIELRYSHESAPGGWIETRAFARKIKIGAVSLERILPTLRSQNPDAFGEYSDNVGELHEYLSPAFQKVIEEEVRKCRAPEGWIRPNVYAEQHSIGRTTIDRFAELHADSLPADWQKEYLDELNRFQLHLSPTFQQLFEREYLSLSKAPESWLSIIDLAEKNGVSNDLVEVAIRIVSPEHPTWFGVFRGPGGRIRALDPAAIPLLEAIIMERRQERPKREGVEDVQPHWHTIQEIERMFPGANRIQRRVDDFIRGRVVIEGEDEYVKYARLMKKSKGTPALHYGPEVVAFLKETVVERPPAPKGWMTVPMMIVLTGRSSKWVNDRLADDEVDHPDDQGEYKALSGKVALHVSAAGADRLKKISDELREVPENFESKAAIAVRLHRSPVTLQAWASKYGKREWIYEVKAGHSGMHYYHPDLVALMEHVDKTARRVEGEKLKDQP